MSERIAGAAVREDGEVFSAPPPQRHHHILRKHAILYGEQGFITDAGRFVSRAEGKQIAIKSGQNLRNTGSADELFSEDMW